MSQPTCTRNPQGLSQLAVRHVGHLAGHFGGARSAVISVCGYRLAMPWVQVLLRAQPAGKIDTVACDSLLPTQPKIRPRVVAMTCASCPTNASLYICICTHARMCLNAAAYASQWRRSSSSAVLLCPCSRFTAATGVEHNSHRPIVSTAAA